MFNEKKLKMSVSNEDKHNETQSTNCENKSNIG